MKLNVEEALRYLGAAKAPQDMRAQMQLCADEITARFQPRYAWRTCSLEKGEVIRLPEVGVTLPGGTARKMLAECQRAVILTCTLGQAFDKWLQTQQARDMTRAVMLDACASAWVEAGCDMAQEEIAAHFPGMYMTDRFSPGYGDVPLSVQPGFLRATDAARRLGVHATPSCLMIPQKSVTALIGLTDRPQRARVRGCAYCALRGNCALSKGGQSCEA